MRSDFSQTMLFKGKNHAIILFSCNVPLAREKCAEFKVGGRGGQAGMVFRNSAFIKSHKVETQLKEKTLLT